MFGFGLFVRNDNIWVRFSFEHDYLLVLINFIDNEVCQHILSDCSDCMAFTDVTHNAYLLLFTRIQIYLILWLHKLLL